MLPVCSQSTCYTQFRCVIRHNHMVVNESKTKEMLIYFGSSDKDLVPPILVNDLAIGRVTTFKLLGFIMGRTCTLYSW